MDFFKSVFSEPTPTSTPTPSPPSTPNSENTPQPGSDSSWPFGSTLFRTIASKSESLLDNYYKDLQEFSSGLKKETSVIRRAASRAVEDLPARFESGAAIAQESLEAVGQAIDNVGSTVSEIIGKDLNFASDDGFSSANLDENAGTSGNLDKDYGSGGNAKPYCRIEAMIRSLQCNMRTYCVEVEESGYDEWRKGFRIEEKREEIERLIEENGVIKEIYDEIVPGKVDEETFWCRYFYRADKAVEAEETRARIVKRAISAEEEEELSWDVDDDDEGGDNDRGGIRKDDKEKGKGVDGSEVENVGVSGTKSDAGVGEERDGSDGKIGSDISIISSQRSSHAEDDLGWDEIEDIGSADERAPSNAIDLRKRLSSAEEDEELSWDVEDDDEKS